MSREIMQQALDALDMACAKYGDVGNILTDWGRWDAAATALRQALAQPEQEPFKPDWVSYRQGVADGAAQPEQDYIKKLENDFCEQLDQLSERNYKLRMELADAKLAQPEQKLIGWKDGEPQYIEQPEQWTPVEIGVDVTPDGAHVVGMYVLMPEAVRHVFYSQFHPASKREWVGLTDEEIDSIFVDYGWCISTLYLRVVRSIEAKLREKNT